MKKYEHTMRPLGVKFSKFGSIFEEGSYATREKDNLLINVVFIIKALFLSRAAHSTAHVHVSRVTGISGVITARWDTLLLSHILVGNLCTWIASSLIIV